LVQVPFDDAPRATEHTSHEPLHALLQQTPSAQLPDAHSVVLAQLEPMVSFGTHCLAALQ
jgi:hypothetical protein